MLQVLRFACPRCHTPASIASVQGDRCPGCQFEFKWFSAAERMAAEDYYRVLTGEKHLLELPHQAGWIVAHR